MVTLVFSMVTFVFKNLCVYVLGQWFPTRVPQKDFWGVNELNVRLNHNSALIYIRQWSRY